MEEKGNLRTLSPDPKANGVPLDVTTPNRVRPVLPEPLCSPIAHQSPFPQGIAMGSTPLTHPSPSPGNRRFVGVSSNARNDIYLKTLMNSPYHKSFTPLSATPNGQGPSYNTPVRTKPERTGSPLKGPVSTPSGTVPPSSEKKFVTPKNMVFNPFDCGVDDLHLPAYMSPGFFTVSSTPASDEKQTFRWSIEHIAQLNPADIEEMPVQQTHMMVDKETEERAQKAIDQFFSSNLIVPSPWSDPRLKKNKNILPVTPATQAGKPDEEMMTELQGSIQKSLPKQGMEDVACQTVLSLPVNFDLQKVLGAYMTQDGTDEGNQQEMLSTSSLRRKLFFHGDTSSLAPSPVKGVGGDQLADPGSPMFVKRPSQERITPLKNTPAFSSSPIKSAGTPSYRRCSSDPEFLQSPELSPIVHGNIHNPIHKSRSSGVFDVDRASFNISPVSDDGNQPRHCCSPVSPIPFQGISPEDNNNEEYHPKFVDSPGFSPICPPKTQIRKILRRSQEESYLQDDGCSSSDEEVDSVTPVSSNPRQLSTSLTPVKCFSPVHKTPVQSTVAFGPKSQSCTDLTETAMDYESGPCAGKDNILTSSLCETRDLSVSNVDSQDDTHTRTHSSSQDTGYQTASLQSTNPESVLHTNLTNQFGSLPFNVTSQETSLQQGASQDNPPIFNLFASFSNPDDLPDTKRSGLSISKQLFPSEPVFPSSAGLLGDQDEHEKTPKNQEPFKNKSYDSALVDDSAIVTDLGVRSMDVDFRKGDIGLVMSEGEEILSRAREALAMANSLYPQEVDSQLPKPFIAKTETQDLQSFGEQRNKEPSASEIAFSILQRAGEDLAKYGNILSYKTTSEISADVEHTS